MGFGTDGCFRPGHLLRIVCLVSVSCGASPCPVWPASGQVRMPGQAANRTLPQGCQIAVRSVPTEITAVSSDSPVVRLPLGAISKAPPEMVSFRLASPIVVSRPAGRFTPSRAPCTFSQIRGFENRCAFGFPPYCLTEESYRRGIVDLRNVLTSDRRVPQGIQLCIDASP